MAKAGPTAISAQRLICLSDLHLSDDTPGTLAVLQGFMAAQATPGVAFALLGDIFEYWVGDDHQTHTSQSLANSCQQATSAGAQVFFMHGNRDFLLGRIYLDACGMELLSDPWQGDLFGTPTVLSHGDLLCTDDTAYQQFRRMSRCADWQAGFLAKPLADRVAYAQQLRAESKKTKAQAQADAAIMDVNEDAVKQALAGHWPQGLSTPEAKRLIHGHTHRPACHLIAVGDCAATDAARAVRWVLPDWDFDGQDPSGHRGHALQISATGIEVLRCSPPPPSSESAPPQN